MKKHHIFLILAMLSLSCSTWKNHYRVEKVRAAKITGRSINRLDRETPLTFDQLRASKNDYVIFREGGFYLMDSQTFKKLYKRKK